jgi:hypothetical protein
VVCEDTSKFRRCNLSDGAMRDDFIPSG